MEFTHQFYTQFDNVANQTQLLQSHMLISVIQKKAISERTLNSTNYTSKKYLVK